MKSMSCSKQWSKQPLPRAIVNALVSLHNGMCIRLCCQNITEMSMRGPNEERKLVRQNSYEGNIIELLFSLYKC